MNVSINAQHLLASSALVPSPSPAEILKAGTCIAEALARGKPVETAALREAMEAFCGGSDAAGFWLWKDAYEAGEVAQVLFLRRFWPAIQARTTSPAARLAMLSRVAGLLPTQTRRSEESEAFQQFSTPLALGYVAALACGLRPGEALLEPSAGTGLLAIHAELAGARLHLNELAATRAGLLGQLFPGSGATQFDAAQIHDRLDASVIPDVVLMNPPFSVAANVEGRYRDATAGHLRTALSRLRTGGRLVAITGEGFRPDRPSTASAFADLAERGGRLVFSAGLSGRAYARHGTTIDVRLSVFDRVPVAEVGRGAEPIGIVPEAGALLTAVLAGVPPRLAPAFAVPARSAIPGLSRRAVARPVATRPAATLASGSDAETAPEVAYTIVEEFPTALAAEAAIYEAYGLETLRIEGAQAHPTPLVQSTAMASVRLPKPSYAPRLPAAIVTGGLLSECQLETVIYAGAAQARHLPGQWTVDETGTLLSAAAEGAEGAVRFRQGFFLGDGTGAGKGRQVAGIILDNWMQGRRRALWISKSDALLEDARRDWRHLGREQRRQQSEQPRNCNGVAGLALGQMQVRGDRRQEAHRHELGRHQGACAQAHRGHGAPAGCRDRGRLVVREVARRGHAMRFAISKGRASAPSQAGSPLSCRRV
ncbi:hypothetical protein MPAR168_24325 [Methylorubrum populi]|uniref:Strawberry notch AAA domain-containing protein n=1 Tax=Methylobacterium radiotolerans TaxID=31998 RepID=A0ABU7TAC6_9HYPH